MNTFLKRVIFILILATGFVFVYSYMNDGLQKRKSPKKTVAFKVDDLNLKVFYNRPSKRGREVFGALVPFDEVWRTGANEATTFETNKALKIGKDSLPKGKYTLWTIPNDTLWEVIFNRKQYPWGVDHQTLEPLREPEFDVINYKAPVETLNTTVEQFTIAFDNSTDKLFMTLAWDDVRIKVPLR
ncbi:DUF2911 domain-containing protein [Hyunsoonleella sp. SJ7]|uniref:DUF2911 domain-containing protein n=1 Tax=Hyunsoonleella aquatilis TaxID=2762758 RepID=A0A923HCL8_9FLAO|nr:DUF2911 domain-containing protein [Hyunsoonleella aquatilis]MBC3759432.1 DUF2911 domain-containing protein [Hyunsoonleella aquatilis]